MEKRLILAIALSGLVLLIFSRLQPQHETTRPELLSAQKRLGDNYNHSVGQQTPPLANVIPISTKVSPAQVKEIETIIETDKYVLTFTNLGGGLKKAVLKEYDTILFDDLNPPISMFAITAPEIETNLNNAEFTVQRTETKLIYSYNIPDKNIKIRKEFNFYNINDYIELQLFIENTSAVNTADISYNLLGPSQIEDTSSLKGRSFVETNIKIDGKILRKTKTRTNHEVIKGIISWIGVKNRYFAIALKPPRDCEGIFFEPYKNQLATGVLFAPRVIRPNTHIEDSYLLYLGPLANKRLAVFEVGLEDLVNYGFFGGISTFLLLVLGGIHSIIHNWGFAIIIVTVLINIVLFPLTRKSFLSMQRMQELQPHMEKLKQLHKDNPKKMNKELMELYRQYNVNPFGGCLPMLLQLPIFFAFYQALMRSIELKNASFLWIKDLSGPDTLFSFPQPIPVLGDKFNLLPLITILVMVVQQRFSTINTPKQANSEMAKQQKFMALFFPIFFGFILYGFPSGLVLYWLTNSALMTAEQIVLRKHMNQIKGA